MNVLHRFIFGFAFLLSALNVMPAQESSPGFGIEIGTGGKKYAFAESTGQNTSNPPATKQVEKGHGKPHKSDSGDAMDMDAMQGETSGDMQGEKSRDMQGMDMSKHHGSENQEDSHSATFLEQTVHHGSSGTSAEPNSTPIPMLMTMRGKWMLMFHSLAFVNDIQQSSGRGRDKFFSTNWFMPMAQRQVGAGTLTARIMVSLEPGTVSRRYYPELFQQGETAFGQPIVDGQHPHDFFMEVALLYDQPLGKGALLSFYFAPMGDPAMGPTAYPHRASASEDPIAALGHHLEDSTHIADDVVTVGLTYKKARLEASGFHGREPDESRWNLDSGKIDSWSSRLTVNPAQNWSLQYSLGYLTSPEALHPSEDIRRMTASAMYNLPIHDGNWASTILWGRNKNLPSGEVWNGYLAESTLRFKTHHYAWGRIEMADRTSELLLGGRVESPNFTEGIIGRAKAYTAGYDRDVDLIPHVATAIGGQLTLYSAPGSLKALYGSHPVGAAMFIRFRPFGKDR